MSGVLDSISSMNSPSLSSSHHDVPTLIPFRFIAIAPDDEPAKAVIVYIHTAALTRYGDWRPRRSPAAAW